MSTKFLLLLLLCCIGSFFKANSQSISLNGSWQRGINRQYTNHVQLPAISEDPTKMQEGTLWFKRQVTLPRGQWQNATLILKGARFAPSIYVNGEKVSEKEGGMAPTFHALSHSAIQPNEKVTIEIALKSLKELSQKDASYIPTADHWRSNISSCIWDDIVLHCHGNNRIAAIIPAFKPDNRTCDVTVHMEKPIKTVSQIKLEVIDSRGKVVITKSQKIKGKKLKVTLPIDQLPLWTTDTPHLFKLKATVNGNGQLIDNNQINFANRYFELKDKQFFLNGKPSKLRAGTVVWHRWVRDQEGVELAFNEDWFLQNVVNRLKDHGANTLRFHLGNPPERFLDMCDKHGLLVQYEWSFFHGMPASKESLLKQWQNWIDLGLRHPSVVLVHPYNETQGKQLETAWDALDDILPRYPKLVLADRDVLHIHKYWWSLFENLGLYYDSYNQFPKAIMVDEFGGNYLDGNGDIGGYKTTASAYMRFLGKSHSREMRLKHHAESNAKVAEYWRRIDATGFSPFCILGSHMDGDHWYMGQLKDGKPKQVWEALTASWSPVSVSLDIWDRNFKTNQEVSIPMHLFNDTQTPKSLHIEYGIKKEDKIIEIKNQTFQLNAFQHSVQPILLETPQKQGKYTFFAQLKNPTKDVKYPVVSEWDFRVQELTVLNQLLHKVACNTTDKELISFLKENQLYTSKNESVYVVGREGWKLITQNNQQLQQLIKQKIENGISVVMLDIGPRYFGQGYPKDQNLGPLQGRYRAKGDKLVKYQLPFGIELEFNEISEPESHIHPAKDNQLWQNLYYDSNWLWNGMRGGLIAPATSIKISGLSYKATLNQWQARGADIQLMKSDSYFAYNLQGFYAYSTKQNNKTTINALRKKVKFLVEDAPSLQNAVDPNAKIEEIDLVATLQQSQQGKAKNLTPLALCGNSLTKTPVIKIDFGKGKGQLILSQLLTHKRLINNHTDLDYSIRQDQSARQTVINMLNIQ
ncbi:glycoside hydrolase [Prolixibacteraceae bacterium JC049]|nr:glycoside hydrolase [Prolixibacteraceae bacterium JC049]